MHPRVQALGRLKKGARNGLEAEYEVYLEGLKWGGKILWYEFEGLKFRLADNTFYTPDFVVLNADSQLEVHEVKGFWKDDARVKIKVAASMYPLVFFGIQKKRGQWVVENF